VRKIQTKDYAELERTINRKLRTIGPNFGIRNLYRTPQGRYRFEMKISVDPREEAKLHEIVRSVLRELPGDRSVQAKYYLPESIVTRVRAKARKKGVSQSALVAECLAESLSVES
jgi:hypothetical protein